MFTRDQVRHLALVAGLTAAAAAATSAQTHGSIGRPTVPAPNADVVAQLRARARPLADSIATWRSFADATKHARVIALGEATHGQHEAFDIKRRLTMELVRHHGVRVVAYEASASSARALDAWIHGAPGDVAPAMSGFGMLIWTVEENAALLRDLRDWNSGASAADQVRLLGVDAQDGEVVAARLRELLGPTAGPLLARIDTLLLRAPAVTQRLFQGERTGFDSLGRAMHAVLADLQRTSAGHPAGAELAIRALELKAHLTMYGTPGGRDHAMADLLLAQLEAGSRVVLWAHNAHVSRGPLVHLRSTQLAMGGHLAAALGRAYYAVGFAFGSGGFQANAPDSAGRWGFKRYVHGPPAPSSLESTLMGAGADFFLDLRAVPAQSRLQQWLRTDHGHRRWGGYNVPDDADAQTADTSRLSRMTPAREYDALLFHLKTTPATPVDRSRILIPMTGRR
jgi:erythromycin esterase